MKLPIKDEKFSFCPFCREIILARVERLICDRKGVTLKLCCTICLKRFEEHFGEYSFKLRKE